MFDSDYPHKASLFWCLSGVAWEQHKKLRRGPSSQEDKFQQMEVPMQMKKWQTTVESNEFLTVICDVMLRWSTKKVLTGTFWNSDKQPGSPHQPWQSLLEDFPFVWSCMVWLAQRINWVASNSPTEWQLEVLARFYLALLGIGICFH